MSKLVFVNRYFYPDHSATSQLLSDLAFYLASQGSKVEVLASRQAYDMPDANLAAHEVFNGVEVRRVWTSRFGRQHLLGRAADYLTFYMSAFIRLLIDVRKGDVVVAKTDPPLISVVAALAVRLRGATLVNWVQDLFPEVATALGVSFPAPMEGFVRSARNWSLGVARWNVVLGKRMARTLIDNGIPPERIKIIHNWSSEDHIVPLSREENQLRKQWGLQDKLVVGYSGNMGRAHEFDTILDAAKLLSDDDSVVFIFIGDGAQKQYIEKKVSVLGLENVFFKPYQSREDLALSLNVPDIHLISLRPELEGLIVPSKFYGIAAAGRPAIFIGDSNGEIAALLREHDCGKVVEIASVSGLREVIHSYAGDRTELYEMGRRARELFERQFTTKQALSEWSEVLGLA